jgi:glycosyltransferase involved in cell wall biosynthesis
MSTIKQMNTNKKKVLYIITKSVWAGASKYVYDLATNLPKDNFDVFVASGGYGILSEKLKTSNIPYFEIKGFQRNVNPFKDIQAFFEILFLLFKIKPDIVHVSSAKAGGLAGLAISIYKLLHPRESLKPARHLPEAKPMAGGDAPRGSLGFVKPIFTAHGWTFNEARPKWQINLIKYFSRLTCLFYDKIICVSQYDYDVAIKNKIAPKEKLVVIHNGIKPEDYNFLSREEAREKISNYSNSPNYSNKIPKSNHQKAKEEIWLGTIGEFTKNKGQKYLIDAINKIQDSRFKIQVFIIGFGEEISNLPDGKAGLKSQISKLHLENQIFLIENWPDASNYMKAFDIFVLPSIKEGLPYVLLEAKSAGVPIVATEVGGIPEIVHSTSSGQVENNKNGLLVEPSNANALAEAIKTLLETPLNSLKPLKNFEFEKMLEKTVEVYLS